MLPRLPLVFLLGFFCAALGLRARAPVAAPAQPGHIRTLYLIRHGAYDMSVQGDEELVNGLTPLGLAEARLIAARLRGMPVEFNTLVSSTYTRARQTADVINQSLPALKHETTKLLCEALPRTYHADTQGATPAELDAYEAQLNAAFAQYFVPAKDADRNDILVCHGNVIRYLVMKALGVDTRAWAGLSVAHCSLTIIQISPSGVCRVLAVGDTGHLPPTLLSGHTRTNPELVAP